MEKLRSLARKRYHDLISTKLKANNVNEHFSNELLYSCSVAHSTAFIKLFGNETTSNQRYRALYALFWNSGGRVTNPMFVIKNK